MSTTPRVDGRRRRYEHRRPELLAAAAEYVLEHGISDLSLRPLAQALGVTHAALIRHFGSKEQLLDEVTRTIRAGLMAELVSDADLRSAASGTELLRRLWRRWSAPLHQRQFLLMFEIYGRTIREREKYRWFLEPIVHDWLRLIEQALVREGCVAAQAPTWATIVLSQVRGLQLDLAGTANRSRVNAAFEAWLDMLVRALPRAPSDFTTRGEQP